MVITKTTDYEVYQISNKPLRYTNHMQEIRANMENKYNKCFVCDKDFITNEDFYILFVKLGLNQVACTECATKLREEMNA